MTTTTTVLQHPLLGHVEIAPGDAPLKNFETLERHLNAEAAGDLATTMGTMTSDPHWIDYGAGINLQGYEAVSRRYANRFATRPGLTVDIQRVVVTENVAVMQMLWKGDGSHPGGVPMVAWMDFKDGKLVGEAAYSNPP